jgi:hypothetical protein
MRAEKVLSLLASMRGGSVKDARFHARMRGSGPRYRIMTDLFDQRARALGLEPPPKPPAVSPFRRPGAPGLLFDQADL